MSKSLATRRRRGGFVGMVQEQPASAFAQGGVRTAGLTGALVGLLLVAAALSGCLFERQDRHGADALEAGKPVVGVWLGSWPGDGNPVVADFSDDVGFEPDLVDIYLDWRTPVANVSHALSHVAATGAVAVLTWEAQTLTTQDILAGTKSLPLRDGRTMALDAYLAEFADGVCASARDHGQPVLLRVLHEMNGGWFAWGISYEAGGRPNTVESYRAAWAKIHQAFEDRCGNQVQFVWAINHFSVGAGTSFTNAYPGDDLVDFVAIDGYNWGTRAQWGWQSPRHIFQAGLCALEGLTAKPILIAEVASSSSGGDKAAWIGELFLLLEEHPQVQGLVWFNERKHEVEIGGELDWDVTSHPEALQAFKDEVAAFKDRGAAHVEASASGCT